MRKIGIAAVALLLAVTFAPSGHVVAEAASTQPNVVFIITDDMTRDQLSRMPTVKAELVDKGMSFTNAFIQDPLCCPSRTSFFRGQMAHTTGMYNIQYDKFGGWTWSRRAGLENQTLPVWMHNAGYYTAEAGKYLNGYNALVQPPGWDYFRGKKGGYTQFAFACVAPDISCPTKSKWQGYGTSTTPAGYETDEAAKRAVESIQRSGTTPLFGWYAFFTPHSPWTPPDRYANETTICGDADRSLLNDPAFNEQATDTVDGTSDKPRWVRHKAYTSTEIAAYSTQMKNSCRALLAADDGVASILAALEVKDPGLQNTIVIFTSDQGVSAGEHMWSGKRVPYEETIRVPFIVRDDGLLLGKAATSGAIIENIDFAPTILDLTGARGTPDCPTDSTGGYRAACEAHGGGFDGYSFAPILKGEPYTERSAFLLEHWDPLTAKNRVPTYCSIRTKTQKLTRYYSSATLGIDWEGYDLTTDPEELHSLVYSTDASGRPAFRGNGQALFDALNPQLVAACSPLPGGGGAEYPAFP